MAGFLANILIAVLVASALLGLFMLHRHYRAGASERRMRTMLRRLGLDPDTVLAGDRDALIRAVRRRCRRCESVGQCEAWLERGRGEDNTFCPNARVFDILATHREKDG